MVNQQSSQSSQSLQSSQGSTKSWQKLSRTAVLLATFLIPLFFLPFTGNVLDFNKQALLTVLVLVAMFAWLLKSLIEEKISLNLGWVSLPQAVLLAVVGLSTMVSAYKYASFWGWPLTVSVSFLSTLAFVLFFFLVIHIFRKAEDVFGLIFLMMISGLIVSLLALPNIFGKSIFPFDFAKTVGFNTIGSSISMAVFLATILPLASVVIFVSKTKLIKIVSWFFIVLSLFLMLAINSQIAWLILLAGSSLILVFGIAKREVFNFSWLFLPMLLLAVSLFALVVRTSIMPNINLPLEVSPSWSTSLKIAADSIKNSKSFSFWLFGSGPGTFVYDYAKYKSADINQTVFWATRFGTGSSELTDRLATTGIIGLLSYLGLVVSGFWMGLKSIIARNSQKEDFVWVMMVGIFASFVGMIVGLVFYPANFTLSFLFWLMLAVIFSLADTKTKTFNLQQAKETDEAKPKIVGRWAIVGVSFSFILVLIVSMGLFFSLGQRYFAEVNYVKALKEVEQGNNSAAVNHLTSAIRLTKSSQDNYWRDLSQVYLFRINEELNKTDVSQEQMSQTVSALISDLVASVKAASDASPKGVANWSVRGFVYGNLLNLVNGAHDWAIKAYEEAVKLEPNNPYLWTEMGKTYVAKADALAQDKEKQAERQEALDKARTNFDKASQLKTDYAPSRFQMAMIDVRENKIKDAITKLEETKVIAPFDSGLSFQLALIYQADKQEAKAQAEYERTIVLNPNYANARYFLGLIYDKKGEKQKALEQFEKIAELNKDNQTIAKIVENLKANKPALEGVSQETQPPIQQKPEEQLEPGTESEAGSKPSPSPTSSPSKK